MNDFDWLGSYSDFLAEQIERAKTIDWRERLRDAVNRTGKYHWYIAEEAGIGDLAEPHPQRRAP
jgi:hypothetical protein